MDSTPLPNQDDGNSDSGLTSTYVIRITPYEKFSFQELHDFIRDEVEICKYVIGRELVPQEHFHLVLVTDISVELQHIKDIIRAFIVPFWSVEGKCPKGFGNKQYNAQVSEDCDKAVSYAVKLGEYVFEGFEDDYIQQQKAESFEKKKPSNFKVEYRNLCDKFQGSDMDIREFMTEFSLLKARYGQQVRMTDAYSYALSNLFLRDPSQVDHFVDNYLYKQ